MKLARIIAAATLVAGLSFSTPAQASSIIGTAQVSLGVSDWTPAGLINTGTTFSFSFSNFISGSGDLGLVPAYVFPNPPDPASTVTTASIVATNGTPVTFNGAWGSFAGTVSNAFLGQGATPLNRTVSVVALGTFTPAGVLAGFDPGPMSLTFSATQTRPQGAPDDEEGSVSASYTIASPPVVPEPATLTLLGLALGSAGFLRRRRR